MPNLTTADLLEYDPLQAAEDIVGASYKDSELTAGLGMLLHMQHTQRKNSHLEMMGDTTLCNELDRYMAIINDLGFEMVLDLPFIGKALGYHDHDRPEHFYIFAQREYGILLKFDTYDTTRVNGGKFCYCWKPNDLRGRNATSSGGFRGPDDDMYWCGDHDCREAIRYNIGELLANGTFMPKWPKDNDMFLWLLHYQDTKVDGYDYTAITEQRVAMLPDWVQEMIGR